MTRFDDRILVLKDNGHDFCTFVGELLRVSGSYGNPIARGAGGVDGCIDLHCDASGTAVECKFVGSNTKDESARVESEWNDVQNKLRNNLRSIDGKAIAKLAQYSPWTDSDRPIRRYVFITSAKLANLAKRRSLHASIEKYFNEELSALEGYQHLKNLVVEINDWTDVELMMSDQPLLTYRWLLRWPSGFRDIEPPQEAGFRSYLFGGKLPYLARDAWVPRPGLRQPWTEQTLITGLAERNAPALAITGHGGSGKTRLAYELARRLTDEGWNAVSCDGRRAKIDGLRELLACSSKPKKIALIADYLETWPDFESFANEAFDLKEATGHTVAIIGTCRTSYRDRLPPFVSQYHIGGDEVEEEYAKAVTRHILSSASIVDGASLAEKCRYNLALATFLLYLKNEHAAKFSAEVGALREGQDFESWIVRRLHSTGLRINLAAALLSACNISEAGFNILVERYGGGDPYAVGTVLIADKWAERRLGDNGEYVWSVFHDIFTDVLLIRSFTIAADRDYWAQQFLQEAINSGSLPQTLTSISRSSNVDAIRSVAWVEVLGALERQSPGVLAHYCYEIMFGWFLTPQQKLRLLSLHPSLAMAVAENAACDTTLGLTALALAEEPPPGFHSTLLPMLDIAANRAAASNIVPRLAFSAQPERYRPLIRKWLSTRPTQMQTHYLLIAWVLNANFMAASNIQAATKYLEEIQPALRTWFDRHATAAQASFVIASSLFSAGNIGGSKGVEYGELASRRASAWLRYGGNDRKLRAADVFRAQLGSIRRLGLLTEGKAIEILTHLISWLSVDGHPTYADAHHAYVGILFASRDYSRKYRKSVLSVLHDPIVRWLSLDENLELSEAGYVFSHWLEVVALTPDVVSAEHTMELIGFAQKWLALHFDDKPEIVAHILDSWLSLTATLAGERRSILALAALPHLERWLEVPYNQTCKAAGMLIRNWMLCAPEALVRKFDGLALQWLRSADDYDSISWLCTAWLEQGRPFRDIAEIVQANFLKKSKEASGTWLLKLLVKQREIPKRVLYAALAWFVRFPTDEDTLSRFANILYWQKVPTQIAVPVIAWVLVAQSVEDLIRDSFKLLGARRLVANLLRAKKSRSAILLAKIYMVRWIKDGRVFCPKHHFIWGDEAVPVYDQSPDFIPAFTELVKTGELNPAPGTDDELVVGLFCDWVSEWRSPPHDIDIVISRLNEFCGNLDLWNRLRIKGKMQLAASTRSVGAV